VQFVLSVPIWIVALVLAALAPTLVRLTADWLERRGRARALAFVARAVSDSEQRSAEGPTQERR
jgi:hypothetical protein